MEATNQSSGPDTGFTVDNVVDGQWVVVSASGELDFATAPDLRVALAAPVLPDGDTGVALNLSGLTFCDSTGIGVLVGANTKLKKQGRRLVLLGAPEFLARKLKTAGVDQVIPLVQTLQDL